MKKLATFLAITLLTAALRAGDFEGTVTWKMKAEISDPALQAKMQAAQAQLATPEMQAKLQQAQTAMQSPQMQEMMRQNPQMKAMIERQMAAMQGPAAASGNPLGGMMPQGFTLKAKGQRSLVIVDGGIMAGEILTLGDKDEAYRINRDERTYQRIDHPMLDQPAAKSYKITRTGQTEKILGYTCTRCEVTATGATGTEKTSYTVWVTKEIKGLDPKQLSALRVGRDRGPNFLEQLDGVPLKMEIHSAQANLMLECTSIIPGALPDALFQLPADFNAAGQ